MYRVSRATAAARLAGAIAGLAVVAVLLASCSLTSTSGGEGTRNIDVSMGGHLMGDSLLDFKAVGYSASRLTIRNTAAQTPLVIGPGTPITTGDGTVVARVTGREISVAPQGLGILGLTAPLAPGVTYYLGSTNTGKPSIRQLFICPGDAGPGGVPAVPDQAPDPSASLLGQ